MFLSIGDTAQKPYSVQTQVTVRGSKEVARLTVGSVALKADHHSSKLSNIKFSGSPLYLH